MLKITFSEGRGSFFIKKGTFFLEKQLVTLDLTQSVKPLITHPLRSSITELNQSKNFCFFLCLFLFPTSRNGQTYLWGDLLACLAEGRGFNAKSKGSFFLGEWILNLFHHTSSLSNHSQYAPLLSCSHKLASTKICILYIYKSVLVFNSSHCYPFLVCVNLILKVMQFVCF